MKVCIFLLQNYCKFAKLTFLHSISNQASYRQTTRTRNKINFLRNETAFASVCPTLCTEGKSKVKYGMGICGQFAEPPTPPRIRLTDWKLHPAGTFIVYRRPRQNWENEQGLGTFMRRWFDRYPAIGSSREISQAFLVKGNLINKSPSFHIDCVVRCCFSRIRSMIIALLRDLTMISTIFTNYNYNYSLWQPRV